jgi:uncharacterized protein (DUF1330 family)
MPKGYLVAHIKVHDPAIIAEFRNLAMPAIAKYGGKVLVTNPGPEIMEGDESGVAVVIEFDDMDTARQFYNSDEYTAARAVRETGATTDLLLAEGI